MTSLMEILHPNSNFKAETLKGKYGGNLGGY